MTFLLTYVLVPFGTALPNTAAPAQHPDPHQDQATVSPARTARLRGALRKLIAHGRQLAVDLTRRPSATTIFWVAVRFGTKDVALILARITRGLRMATALQATLPTHREPPRAACPAPPARKPRTRPAPLPQNNVDSVLATLPTSKEIAAQLRGRPIADVLAEICIDLGILTADLFWQELETVLLENGGDLNKIVEDSDNRIAFSEKNFFPPDIWQSPPTPTHPPAPAPHLAVPTSAGTGPP